MEVLLKTPQLCLSATGKVKHRCQMFQSPSC